MLLLPDGVDFTSIMKVVTFAAEETRVSVNVPILDDKNITKSSEIFSARLQSNQSDVILGDSTANIIILDNDGEI